MRVSVITPTCDRPVAFALCEDWMRQQTRQPDEWIVADGGYVPADCTLAQRHVRCPSPPGATNFARNLHAAIQAVTGDVVVIVEDDDHYAPTHIETLVTLLRDPRVSIVGDDQQRYYNVPQRLYRLFDNTGASLCQTAFKRSVLPIFQRVIQSCARAQNYGIDARLWAAVPTEEWRLQRTNTVVGMKGLPGRAGLGIGHRPDRHPNWKPDPKGDVLRSWLGATADRYFGVLSCS